MKHIWLMEQSFNLKWKSRTSCGRGTATWTMSRDINLLNCHLYCANSWRSRLTSMPRARRFDIFHCPGVINFLDNRTYFRMLRLLKNSLAIIPRMVNWQYRPEKQQRGRSINRSGKQDSPEGPAAQSLHLLHSHAIDSGEKLEKHESMPSKAFGDDDGLRGRLWLANSRETWPFRTMEAYLLKVGKNLV